jgi:hypothetical protein
MTYKKITNTVKTVLFVDDTDTIIANPNLLAFINELRKLLKIYIYIYDWFIANLLSLNTDKTYFMQFSFKNSSLANFNIMMIK